MRKVISTFMGAAVALTFVGGASALAQPAGEPVSQTNQGKGTSEAASPQTSTHQEVFEGSRNLDRDLSAADGTFDDINQPQQDVTTNKAKGTAGMAEEESKRYYERLDYHHQHRYHLDGAAHTRGTRDQPGDRDVRSQTNQGKGTSNRRGEGLYSLDAEYRDSDRHWRETDAYWRNPERHSDEEYTQYWERSDAYWQDSDTYWTESGRYHNEQMKSRTNQGLGTTESLPQAQ